MAHVTAMLCLAVAVLAVFTSHVEATLGKGTPVYYGKGKGASVAYQTSYQTSYKDECKDVCNDVCKKVPKEVCTDVQTPYEVCTDVPVTYTVKKCDKVCTTTTTTVQSADPAPAYGKGKAVVVSMDVGKGKGFYGRRLQNAQLLPFLGKGKSYGKTYAAPAVTSSKGYAVEAEPAPVSATKCDDVCKDVPATKTETKCETKTKTEKKCETTEEEVCEKKCEQVCTKVPVTVAVKEPVIVQPSYSKGSVFVVGKGKGH